jgi:nucleoside 2-deoxyribosyltransferase
MSRKCIYLIGSLRNPRIPEIANALEKATGYEVFADWFTPGPEADDFLRDYVKARNPEGGVRAALQTYAAKHVFEFDKSHIDRSDAAVLVMPAGKSGHLELGYVIGQGKPGFVLFDAEPERLDIMYQFATGLAMSIEELVPMLTRAVGGTVSVHDYKLPTVGEVQALRFTGRPRSY